jgi:hypothetical protein
MKLKWSFVPTYLLALIYSVFGSNYFIGFMKIPARQGVSAEFLGILVSSGYMTIIKILEWVLAMVLVWNRGRALGLVLLAPITFNIFLFECFLVKDLGIGSLLMLLHSWAIFNDRKKYLPLLAINEHHVN